MQIMADKPMKIPGPPGSEGVRIILDGSKQPITLHESYIEPQ